MSQPNVPTGLSAADTYVLDKLKGLDAAQKRAAEFEQWNPGGLPNTAVAIGNIISDARSKVIGSTNDPGNILRLYDAHQAELPNLSAEVAFSVTADAFAKRMHALKYSGITNLDRQVIVEVTFENGEKACVNLTTGDIDESKLAAWIMERFKDGQKISSFKQDTSIPGFPINGAFEVHLF